MADASKSSCLLSALWPLAAVTNHVPYVPCLSCSLWHKPNHTVIKCRCTVYRCAHISPDSPTPCSLSQATRGLQSYSTPQRTKTAPALCTCSLQYATELDEQGTNQYCGASRTMHPSIEWSLAHQIQWQIAKSVCIKQKRLASLAQYLFLFISCLPHHDTRKLIKRKGCSD